MSGLIIKVNNYGFNLTFTIVGPDGKTPRNIGGYNVAFYVWTQEQLPTLLLSGHCANLTQSGATLGQCTYTVQQADFSLLGTFDAELEMTTSSEPYTPPYTYLEDTDTFTVAVIPRHPPPS